MNGDSRDSGNGQVQVGQVWESMDSRDAHGENPRHITVTEVHGTHAVVFNPQTRRHTKIRLERFRPGSTGYRLIEEAGAVEVAR